MFFHGLWPVKRNKRAKTTSNIAGLPKNQGNLDFSEVWIFSRPEPRAIFVSFPSDAPGFVDEFSSIFCLFVFRSKRTQNIDNSISPVRHE